MSNTPQMKESQVKRITERLLTVFELEQLTGRRVSTWRKAILEKRIPVVRLGRSVRVPIEAVQRMIDEGWQDAIATGGDGQ